MASVEKEAEMSIKIRKAKLEDSSKIYKFGAEIKELNFSNKWHLPRDMACVKLALLLKEYVWYQLPTRASLSL